MRVDEGDDLTGRVNGRPRDVHGYTQRAESVPIGWRNLHEGYIEGPDILPEQQRGLAQENGHIAGASLGHGRPKIGPDKQGRGVKGLFKTRIGQGHGPFQMQVYRLHVAEFGRTFGQGFQQYGRGSRRAMHKYTVVAANHFYGFLRGYIGVVHG